MGKVRQRAVMLKCGECDAGEGQPCIHKTTGKPLNGFHKSRVWGARKDVLNAQVAQIEGALLTSSISHQDHRAAAKKDDEEFWKWVDRWFGLDPTDQYNSEW